MNMKKKFFAGMVLAVLMTAGLTSCGTSSASMNTVSDSAAGNAESYSQTDELYMEDAEASDAEDDGGGLSENAEATNRKLIRTVNMSVETEEYEKLVANIEKKVSETGGYIESRTEEKESIHASDRYRYASMTLRIPADQLDGFLSAVAEESNITYQSENVEDVTLNYVDLESHKTALEEEEKRLLELMGQAETIEDLITIENSLTDIRYQLESMESQLRVYDNQVDYSTVYIDISEVTDYTQTAELTTGEKIMQGFTNRLKAIGNGFKEFGIFLVIHIPDLVLAAVIVTVVIIIIKKSDKRKRRKQQQTPQNNTDAAARKAAPRNDADTAVQRAVPRNDAEAARKAAPQNNTDTETGKEEK